MSDDTPAFPVPNDANVLGQEGMSLRDYFAAQTLVSMGVMDMQGWTIEEVATEAYRYADAMLIARKASNGE